jgi:hypothetical protein
VPHTVPGMPLMTGAIAPQFVEPLIAPAAVAVKFVANRILDIVVLMIVLCRVELRGLGDLRDNHAVKWLVFFQLLFRGFGELLLLCIVIKNAGAVLTAVIAKLAVFDRGIDIDPKHVEQFLLGNLCRIINHLDSLRVTGGAG